MLTTAEEGYRKQPPPGRSERLAGPGGTQLYSTGSARCSWPCQAWGGHRGEGTARSPLLRLWELGSASPGHTQTDPPSWNAVQYPALLRGQSSTPPLPPDGFGAFSSVSWRHFLKEGAGRRCARVLMSGQILRRNDWLFFFFVNICMFCFRNSFHKLNIHKNITKEKWYRMTGKGLHLALEQSVNRVTLPSETPLFPHL